ncbi:MATE family efflux transporter [Gammaproteobacteria bacterium]|nr:MATE family efflux transporter [Gammaproteobacteria bacterium]
MLTKFKKEFKSLIQIGLPIFGSQVSYVFMGTTDTLVAGRASSIDLAALAIGSAITHPIWLLIAGITFAITPIVAQLYGAKEYNKIGYKLGEIIWIALGLGSLFLIIYPNLYLLVNLLELDPEVARISGEYLKALSVGMFAITIFTCLRCYSEGMTLTLPIFYISLAGMLINIPLDIIFVYGYFGVPKMGGVGCGYATSIVSVFMTLTLIIYIAKSKYYSNTKPFQQLPFPSRDTLLEIFKLGFPIGLGIFIELAMFSGAAIIISPLGTEVVAGHAIAMNIASFFFIISLSVGLAAATRVGNLIGAKRMLDARFASISSICLCTMFALVNTIIILSFKDQLSAMFSAEEAVVLIASNLLIFAAIFQIPDGAQIGAIGALRGYKDTFAPMIITLLVYWFLAIPFGYYLTYYGLSAPLGASGMWIAMIGGLTIFAVLIILRVQWITKKFNRAIV